MWGKTLSVSWLLRPALFDADKDKDVDRVVVSVVEAVFDTVAEKDTVLVEEELRDVDFVLDAELTTCKSLEDVM